MFLPADLFDYRVQVINLVKADGYSDSAACALAERYRAEIQAAYHAGLVAAATAATVIALDENEEDTPIVVEAEQRAAVLDAIEQVMEEGR